MLETRPNFVTVMISFKKNSVVNAKCYLLVIEYSIFYVRKNENVLCVFKNDSRMCKTVHECKKSNQEQQRGG